jgi:hypothetical protein
MPLKIVQSFPTPVTVIQCCHQMFDGTAAQHWNTGFVTGPRAYDRVCYYGLKKLLDGIINYKTRAACRKEFVLDLLGGYFLNLSGRNFHNICREIGRNTGSDFFAIMQVILEVNSVFEQKMTPGGWDTREEVQLVPGVDFNAFIHGENGKPCDDIRDWLESEDDSAFE